MYVGCVIVKSCQQEVGSRLTTMIHELERKVDPFDLDVFLPHLSTRVKLAAHRAQVSKYSTG